MRRLSLSIGLLAGFWVAAGVLEPAHAQSRGGALLADGSVRIHGIALGPAAASDRESVALLASQGGSESIIVRSINRKTGLRLGDELVITFPESRLIVKPVQAFFSRILAPGSLLVLDTSLSVHKYPLAFMTDGTPFIAGGPGGATVLGPFGDPSVMGEGTALAEAPAPNAAMLAIGTNTGQIIAVLIGIRAEIGSVSASSSAIDGVVAVPQVGHFEFVAITGGHLLGVAPASNTRTQGINLSITFDLKSPTRFPGITSADGPALDLSSQPLSQPTPVRLVAANGTSDVAGVEIPANPILTGPVVLDGINRLGTGISQVAVGSLAALTADGTGVFYQPGSTPERVNGGRTFTLAGATFEFEPDTLNLRSNGRFVEASIEVENGEAATINAPSLLLQVEGVPGSIPIAAGSKPSLDAVELENEGESDDDIRNPRLRVQFDRGQLEALLSSVTGPSATLIVTWLGDGSVRGVTSASTEIRIVH